MRRKKITLEEHSNLGKYLRIAYDKLSGSDNKLDVKALKLMSSLRDILEQIMCHEHQNEMSRKNPKFKWTEFYYGSTGRRDE